jgi:hypothetical protein
MQIGEGIATSQRAPSNKQQPPGPPGRTLIRPTIAIIEILGLYRPGHDDSAARADRRRIRCGYQPAYTSSDDQGRVFINHVPRPGAAGSWERAHSANRQYVDLTVEVTVSGGPMPSGVRVLWEWSDPDDPSDTGMHAGAAAYVDANRGAGDDNNGQCDFPRPAASVGARFEGLPGFALTRGTGPRQRSTPVVGGRSRVRLHCTNVGGDNFRVTARVAPHPGLDATPTAQTGVMTMWKRIDVEHRVMQGALALPVDFEEQIQRHFAPCFVQFDFTAPQPSPVSRLHLTPHDRDVETASERVTRGVSEGGVFEHAGQFGWYLLLAANHASGDVAGGGGGRVGVFSATVHSRTLRGEPYEFFRIPGRLPASDIGVVNVRNPAVTPARPDPHVWMRVYHARYLPPPHDSTEIYFSPVTYVPRFEGGRGRVIDAYEHREEWYPMHRYVVARRAWRAGGLGLSSPVQIELSRPGAVFTRGITVARDRHFTGRTIVFTQAGRPSGGRADPSIMKTLIHELGHTFGLPHQCGYPSWQNADNESCCMNYRNNWLYAPGTLTPRPFHRGVETTKFCDHHIKAIREVHLEDNPQMGTR